MGNLPGQSRNRRKLSSGRRVLFTLLAAALCLLCVELGARGLYRIAFGRGYDPETLRVVGQESGLDNLPGNLLPSWVERSHILHPYLGYVMHRGKRSEARHGLVTSHLPIQQRNDDTLLVGLFGGSVAFQLRHSFQAVLEKRFAELGDHRQVRLINVALPGHKQPQQLMALTYLVFLGAEFDIVVNVDGFNEVSLATSGNYDKGIYPFFPDAWNLRIGLPSGSAWLPQIEDIEQAREELEQLDDEAQDSALRASAIF
jgi:hypothetical protein